MLLFALSLFALTLSLFVLLLSLYLSLISLSPSAPGYNLLGCDTSAVHIPFDDLTISGESWLQNDGQLVAPVVLESIEVENKTGIVFRNL
jgi:hypothetical protein